MPYEKLDQPAVTSLLFHPRADEAPVPEGCEDSMVAMEDGTKIHVRYHLIDDLSKPAILFFHGNGEIVSDYDDVAPGFQSMDVSFIAAEFRGYGRSDGAPLASKMMIDSSEILSAVEKELTDRGFTGKLLVMGRSLGSAPAMGLAARFPQRVAGLLIDSGFAYTRPLLQTIGVDVDGLGIAEEDGLGTLNNIKQVLNATYILHGQNDEIIALDNASHLIAECPAAQKEFQMVPGAGHNNIMQVTGKMYFEVMGRFVKKIGQVRKKKKGVR